MNNNILKYLVPVVAVIVLAESVMLISGMNKKQTANTTNNNGVEKVTQTQENPIYTINIGADKESYKIGEMGKVMVSMVGKESKAVDSINVYVTYDPEAFDIEDLIFDKKLPTPVFSKVSTSKKLVVANFLVSESKGLELGAGEELNLMSFNIKAKKAGDHTFGISTGQEMKESVTMIVENEISKPISFSSNELMVNVLEK